MRMFVAGTIVREYRPGADWIRIACSSSQSHTSRRFGRSRQSTTSLRAGQLQGGHEDDGIPGENCRLGVPRLQFPVARRRIQKEHSDRVKFRKRGSKCGEGGGNVREILVAANTESQVDLFCNVVFRVGAITVGVSQVGYDDEEGAHHGVRGRRSSERPRLHEGERYKPFRGVGEAGTAVLGDDFHERVCSQRSSPWEYSRQEVQNEGAV